MQQQDRIPHLFRSEYRKIIAVLCSRFGYDLVQEAEDIASDTFLAAAMHWSFHGMPNNPAAWLYKVASNKAKNHFKRKALFQRKISSGEMEPVDADLMPDLDLSEQNIIDSQLQMIFVVCDPGISPQAQVALSLRLLCGFGNDEIASAFLSSKETISKRVQRAKEFLRKKNVQIQMPPMAEMDKRLESIITTIYLLFSEGYYSTTNDQVIRKDLCLEAIRLCGMLIENDITNTPQVNALMSLMCFQASRLDARKDETGELILYEDQDRNLWNKELIGRGAYFLKASARGNQLSKYHLEAAISYWHSGIEDHQEKWKNILMLYDQLLELEYSPVAALNRCYVLAKVEGKTVAIAEAEKLRLDNNQFYHVLLGELYSGIHNTKANEHLFTAMTMAKTASERALISKKIRQLTAHP